MTYSHLGQCSDIILSRLISLHPRVIDLNLDRVKFLMSRIDQPHKHLPPTIHVAGTNGKGSVISFLYAILKAIGKKVHVYTSPHLVEFRERIQLQGDFISDEHMTCLLEECERANQGKQITFFEITTCAAFLAFARTPGDILLLETGLGGRLDATNIIEKPLLTIITEISLDHQGYLGPTIRDIAREKAGILKDGVPCILGRQKSEAEDIILEKAEKLNVPVIREDYDWSVNILKNGFNLKDVNGEVVYPNPSLSGWHQFHNAGIAIKAIKGLENIVAPDTKIAEGLQSAVWPGRLQRLRNGPLIDMLPDGWDLWLDGAHNESAAKALSKTIQSWSAQGDKKAKHLIIGMLNSKEPDKFLRHFLGIARNVITIDIQGEENTFSSQYLAQIAIEQGHTAKPAKDIKSAVKMIIDTSDKEACILVCGSLHLAGHVLKDHV